MPDDACNTTSNEVGSPYGPQQCGHVILIGACMTRGIIQYTCTRDTGHGGQWHEHEINGRIVKRWPTKLT